MSIRNSPALVCLSCLATLLAPASFAQETILYGYDALGRVITVTYGNGTVTTYGYDAAGNRTQVTTGPGGGGPGGGGGNTDPVAVGDYFERRVGTTTTLLVLANDSDPNGNPLQVSAVTAVTGGSASVTSGGASVTYVAPGTPGTYNFNYTVSDGQGGADSASVEVFVKYGEAYCSRFPDNPYC